MPSKLSRHFSKKHENCSDKPASYIKRLLQKRKQQSVTFTEAFQVSTKSQHASYLVAEIIVKNLKPHTEAEKVIFPACSAIVKTMFGPQLRKKYDKFLCQMIPFAHVFVTCQRLCKILLFLL